jgi:hypothetical protein
VNELVLLHFELLRQQARLRPHQDASQVAQVRPDQEPVIIRSSAGEYASSRTPALSVGCRLGCRSRLRQYAGPRSAQTGVPAVASNAQRASGGVRRTVRRRISKT